MTPSSETLPLRKAGTYAALVGARGGNHGRDFSLRVAQKVRAIGVTSSAQGVLETARNQVLRSRYGFDRWHVAGNYHLRPYKAEAVQIIDAATNGTVVEIGCGLGDIVSRTSSARRIGLDPDPRVLDAARSLHPEVEFGLASLDTAAQALSPMRCPNIDVLVMLNWPHELSINDLPASLEHVNSIAPIHRILIDLIRPGVGNYAHHHTAEEFETLAQELRLHPSRDGVRSLALLTYDARAA